VAVVVILVIQWGSDPKVTEEYGAVIIDEEICGFDISVNKTVDVQITTNRGGTD
jgi:hypothetical protein